MTKTYAQKMGDAAVAYFDEAADLKGIRFGQYFVNNYMPKDTVWPELFYETDTRTAIQMILNLDNKEIN